VHIPAIAIPWSEGWPLVLAGLPVPGVTPSPPAPLGMGVATGLGGVFSPAGGLPHQRNATSRTRRGRVGHRHPASHADAGSRRVMAGPLPSWLGHIARPPLPAHAPGGLSPAPRRHGAVPPGPARSAPEPSSSPPPLSVPMTGSGPAAAVAASGGGGAAAVLMTVAALLLIFLLSTRVSLDLSAWRSTLLSLRLERPG
jgi:hypothetical protein